MEFQKHIEEELEDEVEEISIEQKWQNIKATLKGAADSILGLREQGKQKPWVTNEMLSKMEKRTTLKQRYGQKSQ